MRWDCVSEGSHRSTDGGRCSGDPSLSHGAFAHAAQDDGNEREGSFASSKGFTRMSLFMTITRQLLSLKLC